MLLSLVLILLLIGAAVVGSLYSNFIVFYKSFSETDSYNKAYYASIAALERGELVTKQREPGYVGSGGWIGKTGINLDSVNGSESDKIESNFSYLVESDDTSVLRDVNSRTNRIPITGEGDVDWMLSIGDSTNYNKMDYENAEVFLLYIDNLDDSPYTKKSCSKDGDCYDVKVGIEGQIRLPPKMKSTFGRLDTTKSPNIRYNQDNKDDEIVDWQLRGKYNGEQFTIFSYNKYNGLRHSVIKESDVNATVNLRFGKDEGNRQPIYRTSNPSAPLIVVSSKAKDISGSFSNFKGILNPSNSVNSFSRLNLRLSLLNILQAESSGMIYPYLEYYLDFTDDVADKYFKINGEGKYKDYQVNIIMHKPTIKESVLGNFTAIF